LYFPRSRRDTRYDPVGGKCYPRLKVRTRIGEGQGLSERGQPHAGRWRPPDYANQRKVVHARRGGFETRPYAFDDSSSSPE